MATLVSDSSPAPSRFHHRRKSWARRVERICCNTLSYFPLVFVYGLTTWAVWVEVNVSFFEGLERVDYATAALGVLLYGLANVSYTIAVFTSAGSPLDPRQDASRGTKRSGEGRYDRLPTHEQDEPTTTLPLNMTTVTAKRTGSPRYCKKCRCVKPDRTHHCSSCGRCVLKMDHHCPWLATCVGLRNYKPFLLFLVYTSLFCWLCLAVSARCVWSAIIDDGGKTSEEGLRLVNIILLSVLSGIIGLVLSGFTAWHIYLALSGQTTIESLEKTRYLSPLRKSIEHQLRPQRNYLGKVGPGENEDQERSLLEQLKETHANALPGILRPEEGEDTRSLSTTPVHQPILPSASGSPAKDSLQRSFASLEEQRERDRYDAYLDEQDSEKLPNAFDMGWKRNLSHVFGPRPLLWFLPVCNTSSDGWMWDVSPKWTEARAEISRQREARAREGAAWERRQEGVNTFAPPPRRADYRWQPGQGFVNHQPPYVNGSTYGPASPSRQGAGHVQMQPLDRRKGPNGGDDVDSYDTSSDEESSHQPSQGTITGNNGGRGSSSGATANWNDIPDDYLSTREKAWGGRSSSRNDRKKGD